MKIDELPLTPLAHVMTGVKQTPVCVANALYNDYCSAIPSSEQMIVTFQDNLTFRARNSFLQNVSDNSPKQPQTMLDSCSKLWQRAVDYGPRNHQTRLTSARFSFNAPAGHFKETEKHKIASEKVVKKNPSDFVLPKLAEERDFVRKFRPQRRGDDREWSVARMVEQYKNPKPHNHRGVSITASDHTQNYEYRYVSTHNAMLLSPTLTISL